MPDNPRTIQVSSEFELQATQLFLEYLQRAYLAGMLSDEWHVGVQKPRGGAMQATVEIRAKPAERRRRSSD
jgi:hypothetical protein